MNCLQHNKQEDTITIPLLHKRLMLQEQLFCTNGGMKFATIPSEGSHAKSVADVLSNRQYGQCRFMSFSHSTVTSMILIFPTDDGPFRGLKYVV